MFCCAFSFDVEFTKKGNMKYKGNHCYFQKRYRGVCLFLRTVMICPLNKIRLQLLNIVLSKDFFEIDNLIKKDHSN